MQTLKHMLIPMIGSLAALAILVGSYYFAKSNIPAPAPDVPITPITVLGGPSTPDPMGAFLTPTNVERGPDGRYISRDPRQIIPDNSLRRGAISRIIVPDHIAIQTVKVVNLHVTHPDTGELVVQLLSPDLVLYTLVEGLCPGKHNWLALTLDDQAGKALGSECIDNLNDAYVPLDGHRLSIFNNGDAQGEWVLTVKDNKAGNIGYLESWSLLFNTPFGKGGTPGPTTPATPLGSPLAATPVMTGTRTALPTGTPAALTPTAPAGTAPATSTPLPTSPTITSTPIEATPTTGTPLSFTTLLATVSPAPPLTANPVPTTLPVPPTATAETNVEVTPTDVPLVYYP